MNIVRSVFLYFTIITLGGCISAPGISGSLGYGQERRVVIVGENVSRELAYYYQHRYDAKVWFTPPRQKTIGDSLQKTFTLGPSLAMRSLINELESINYTMGRWEIIVPGTGEDYVLATLKNMKTGSLAHARGNIVLTDSKSNPDMEGQVARVTTGSFFVTYEGQKYSV